MGFNPRVPCGTRLFRILKFYWNGVFQSTRPVWDATRFEVQGRRARRRFNPRVPCGTRRRCFKSLHRRDLIVPARERDSMAVLICREALQRRGNFNHPMDLRESRRNQGIDARWWFAVLDLAFVLGQQRSVHVDTWLGPMMLHAACPVVA